MFKINDTVTNWRKADGLLGVIEAIEGATAIVWFNRNYALPERLPLDDLSKPSALFKGTPKTINIGSKVTYQIESYNGCGIVLAFIRGEVEMVKVALGIWAGAYLVIPLSEVTLCE